MIIKDKSHHGTLHVYHIAGIAGYSYKVKTFMNGALFALEGISFTNIHIFDKALQNCPNHYITYYQVQ